jgi:peroxiredoxin
MATRDEIDIARWTDARLAALDPPADWIPGESHGLARIHERRHSYASPGRRWMWLVAVATTIAVFVIAVPDLKGFAHACREFVTRGLSGSAATEWHQDASSRALFTDGALRDFSGKDINLAEYRGKVLLVTYWTTACAQCESEISWFSEFQQRYGEQGFVVLLGNPASVPRHIATAIPTTFIVDRMGRIAVRHQGYCSKREFESDIRTVLAER